MNLELNEIQRMIQDTARNFAQNELEPVAAQLDENPYSEENKKIFLGNLKKLAELGLMGINVSAEYGGSEAGVISFSVAMTEIGRACASTAVTMSVNNMVAEVIQSIGSEDQKQKYCSKICSGEYSAGGFALTETSAGSDPSDMRTQAVLDGNEWVVNGGKIFITSAEYAGCYVLWAVTDREAKKGRGISTFILEQNDPGFTVGRAEHKMGQKASATNELIFDNCRFPKDRLMGKLNDGFRAAVAELTGGRIGIGSMALGIGLAAMDYATKYAKDRIQFGQPIVNFQAIQWMISERYTELEAARLLLMNAAYQKENTDFFARESSMAKYFATEAAERACRSAVQMLGGYGYTAEYP
ncbi:MAG: acyl-CoA dehydrogenase family protein, partial [Deltaproteobacteria bacterium]|nr:acyl-CoA dehydrogenase family protein [Deltaproteobacteria bacterium]